MILAFSNNNIVTGEKTGFVEKILSGEKIHTLRKGHRWKAGMQIHMATGIRSSRYHQFNKGIDHLSTCISTQKIEIEAKDHTEYMNDYKIFVDNRELSLRDMQELAWNDGFDCLASFWMWFSNQELFPDQIIHWTDKRY